jgi:hypothetical protein
MPRGGRGVSMLFVLAAMLLLMAIGVSALTAAGASWGARLNKQAENQLNLYINSMELTVRDLLNQDSMKNHILLMTNGNDGDVNIDITLEIANLAGQNWPGLTFPVLNDFTGDPQPPITISGVLRGIVQQPCEAFIPEVPAVPPTLDDDGNPIPGTGAPAIPAIPHKPRRVAYNGNLEVKITAEFGGMIVISVTTYQYTGGILEEEDNTPPHGGGGTWDPMTVIRNEGNLTFRRHERVDWSN